MELEDAKSQREHEWRLAQMNRTNRYQDDNGLGDNEGMEEAGDVYGTGGGLGQICYWTKLRGTVSP